MIGIIVSSIIAGAATTLGGSVSQYFWDRFAPTSEKQAKIPELYVKLVQLLVNLQGEPIDIDGYYADETEKAVRRLQTKAGLRADGVAGVDTIEEWIERLRPAKEPLDA